MRLFGAERITKVVDRMGMQEGEVLQHSMLSSSIERAQKKVEENNFGIRKRLLEYDDVMNSQREVIYNKRRNALYGERIEVDVKNMIQDYAEILAQQKDSYDYQDFSFELMRQLSIEPSFDETFFKKASVDEVSDKVAEAIREVIARRSDLMVKQAWPIIDQVYRTQGAAYENIAIPVSDGAKIMQLVINLKKAYENQGMELYKAMAKSVTLVMIDEYWKEHLRDMDDLKQSVQNATYEQKDPLLIYKFESFNLFKGILEKISRDVLAFMTRAHIPLRHKDDEIPVREQQQKKRTDLSNMQTSRNDLVTNGGEPKSNAPVHVEKRVGRNDPCPCGSGKKFKNCHGKEN